MKGSFYAHLLAASVIFSSVFVSIACTTAPIEVVQVQETPPASTRLPFVIQASHAAPVADGVSLPGGLFLTAGVGDGLLLLWDEDGRILRRIPSSGACAPLGSEGNFVYLTRNRRGLMAAKRVEGSDRLLFEAQSPIAFLGSSFGTLLPIVTGENDKKQLRLIDAIEGEVFETPLPPGLVPSSAPSFSVDGRSLLLPVGSSVLLFRLSFEGGYSLSSPSLLDFPPGDGPGRIVSGLWLGPDRFLLHDDRGKGVAWAIDTNLALHRLWCLDLDQGEAIRLETAGDRMVIYGGKRIKLYRFSTRDEKQVPRLYHTIRGRASTAFFSVSSGYLLFNLLGTSAEAEWGNLFLYDDDEGLYLDRLPGSLSPLLEAFLDGERRHVILRFPDRIEKRDFHGILVALLSEIPRDASALAREGNVWGSGADLSLSVDMQGLIRIEPQKPQCGAPVSLAVRGSEWVSFTDGGLFAGSRNADTMFGVAGREGVLLASQHADPLNRPDMHIGPTQEADAKALWAEIPPRVVIEAAENHRITDMKASESLSFSLLPGGAPIDRYQISVNGVPLYAGEGKKVERDSSLHFEEEIELFERVNKIEIRCTDIRGITSLPRCRYATVRKAKAGETYYVGFGISGAKGTLPSLRYAAKDASDLHIYFDNVVFDRSFAVTHRSYNNTQISPQSFQEAHRFLMNTSPDDTVVLFFSGPLSSSKDSDGRFLMAPEVSIPFQEFWRLLDAVPARRRLLLLDAVDVDGAPSFSDPVAGEAARFYSMACFPRTGAVILDANRREAAADAEEVAKVKNSLFAEALLQTLVSAESDRDKNGHIDGRELFRGVASRVEEWSLGNEAPVLFPGDFRVQLFLPMVTDFGTDVEALLRQSDEGRGIPPNNGKPSIMPWKF
ncbi:hypothetical protein [Sediminispirochaeta smaragdinae]|uniref:EF-hand domain-containing protein n=1 Tax=Sediminispirochaeta smaragdinae (strain DSM 11293 / JCM 15392 / SEBR 4228) TaxID=573413 RepID=E1R806_SEDSS|nr:hypothetical protein [Sediminispirochaeta smaragdinae]ADK82861.1 hypothetical protein Spirs_3775 [Sediminispirochaeta smaragdinae DSM 11293]